MTANPLRRMKQPRTRLSERRLPTYTKGEERFNMITHIAGGAFALTALVLCAVFAAIRRSLPGLLSGVFYCLSMLTVYVISSVYHGLDPDRAHMGKRVMQVIDHCDIYGLIVGSFAPVVFTGLRYHNPAKAWVSFGIVCVASLIGLVFTAIDFGKYGLISYSAYFIAGWSVLFTVKDIRAAFCPGFTALLVAGGIAYTAGMPFFIMEMRHKKYCHAVFHLFILLGSALHFIAIFKYCILAG